MSRSKRQWRICIERAKKEDGSGLECLRYTIPWRFVPEGGAPTEWAKGFFEELKKKDRLTPESRWYLLDPETA